ncbi:hypothetical protein E2C01_006915 [Portunus trituberculatus]|uniref:Uncharacterized protein n=1 Tax=Portunus trituberculatus TaxID=210409 RepID=A0A5B7CY24_PORTR|nr:hypothetical protein [Portunus trituberculatus]
MQGSCDRQALQEREDAGHTSFRRSHGRRARAVWLQLAVCRQRRRQDNLKARTGRCTFSRVTVMWRSVWRASAPSGLPDSTLLLHFLVYPVTHRRLAGEREAWRNALQGRDYEPLGTTIMPCLTVPDLLISAMFSTIGWQAESSDIIIRRAVVQRGNDAMKLSYTTPDTVEAGHQ